ncbi:hypothetical protein ACTFIY_005517 [Dictyostelium cf. discoideum]
MKVINSSRKVQIPENGQININIIIIQQYIVTVDVKGRSVKVTGPRGTLSKSFDHASVDINLVGKKELTVDLWFGNRKQIACIKTITSIIENMITGVTKGYEYKMRFVYAHFPINVAVTDGGRVVEIRNFFGEKIVRRIELLDGITCYRNEKAKDEIVLTGNSLELLSQSCATIQLRSAIKYKDVRKFLDGIYVSERNVLESN